jgi:hypothetical protein
MTEQEFRRGGFTNKHCKFIFNGVTVTGVISTFFMDEPNEYYLVKSSVMREFQEYMNNNNYSKMKLLCTKINFSSLESATILPRTLYTTKAKMVLEGLLPDKKMEITRLIETAHRSSFHQQSVLIGNTPMFVLRSGFDFRVIIEKDQYGIIVNDILIRGVND